MSEKPTDPPRQQNPKPERLDRSAEALRANLLKRKAQKRARTDKDRKPDDGTPGPEEAA